MPGPQSDRRRFACRWLSIRRVGFARRLSQISVAFLLAPVVIVYVLGILAEAFGIRLLGSSSIDAANTLFIAGVAASVLFAVASAFADMARTEGKVELVVGQRGLTIRRKSSLTVIDRSRIASGIMLSSEKEPCVELHLVDGAVLRAGIRDKTRREALLTELGIGPDRRRVELILGSQQGQLAAGCFAFPVAGAVVVPLMLVLDGVLRSATPVLIALIVVALTLLARRAFRPPEIVVGADGVHVVDRFESRFLRFPEIARVASDEHAVVLFLRPDAEQRRRDPVRVRCSDPFMSLTVVMRVRDAMAIARGGAPRALVSDALDPGDRPLAAWRASLAKVMRRDDQYRSASLAPDDVLAVLEDPAAPPKLRIGAALALRESGAADARQKVRIAAETCADASLREALEATAEADLDERPIAKVLRAG